MVKLQNVIDYWKALCGGLLTEEIVAEIVVGV